MSDKYLERISIDPKVMVGKPVIRGTRLPVELVVRRIGQGMTIDEMLREYPRLTIEDIYAALLYAAAVVANENVFPMSIEPA
ncbi:MAG TPA: DUF433 domain-containing protein [Anaerolineae bacterium]|nr:DUF433 domain-containing protein [Anaerolineae bacterium]